MNKFWKRIDYELKRTWSVEVSKRLVRPSFHLSKFALTTDSLSILYFMSSFDLVTGMFWTAGTIGWNLIRSAETLVAVGAFQSAFLTVSLQSCDCFCSAHYLRWQCQREASWEEKLVDFATGLKSARCLSGWQGKIKLCQKSGLQTGE